MFNAAYLLRALARYGLPLLALVLLAFAAGSAWADADEDLIYRYSHEGTGANDKGDYEHAIDQWEKVVAVAGKRPEKFAYCLVITHIDLGNAYHTLGRLDKSLENFTAASRIFLAHPEAFKTLRQPQMPLVDCYLNIGVVKNEMGAFGEGMQYAQAALARIPGTGDDMLSYKASCYGAIAISLQKLGRYDEALRYFANKLALYEKLKSSRDQASTLNDLGLLYADRKSYGEALGYYDKSLARFRKVADTEWEQGLVCTNAAEALQKLGKAEEALKYAQYAIFLFKKLGGYER